MTYLKNNILTIILCLALGLYIWRSNTLKYQRDNIESKVLKEFVISHLKELDKQLDEVQLKSTADSIARNEVLKTLPKYEKNLSITRLKFIRDSLRAGHHLSN